MNKHLKRFKVFDPAQMKAIGLKHLSLWVRRFSEQGRDKDGKKLPPYSEGYIDRLTTDFRTSKGQRYKGMGQRPLSTGAQKISKRQFNLTGQTAKTMSFIKADNDSYTLGWNNPREATIAEANANRKKKRDIISDIPNNEWDWLGKQLGMAIDKEWRKVKNVTIKVKM